MIGADYCLIILAMNQNNINCIKKKHFKKLKQYALLLSKDFDQEAIHRFRVEYKKLRAFVRLGSLSLDIPNKVKMSKKLKNWYIVFGHLRDLQLQRQRIISVLEIAPANPHGYIDFLNYEIIKLKNTLSEKCFEAAIKKNEKKINKGFPEKISKSNCLKFVTRNLLMVYQILLKGYMDDLDFHAVRKYLKDIFYYLADDKLSLSDIEPSTIFNSIDDSFLKSLLEELGKFQDLCTAIVLLKSTSLDAFTLEEQNILVQLNKQWVQEKEQLSKNFNSILKGENCAA